VRSSVSNHSHSHVPSCSLAPRCFRFVGHVTNFIWIRCIRCSDRLRRRYCWIYHIPGGDNFISMHPSHTGPAPAPELKYCENVVCTWRSVVHIPPGFSPTGQTPLPFTWCRTFPFFYHHHPPIYILLTLSVPRLEVQVLTLTDPQRVVLTLTLTLTDARGGNYLKTDTNSRFWP